MFEIGSQVGRQPLKNIATNSDAINVMAAISNTLRKITFDNNFRVSYNPGGGIFVSLAQQASFKGFPWGAEHPWGLVSVAGNQVTIAAGRFYAGAGSPLATPQTTFTITDDASYIGLKYDPSAGTLALVGPTTSEPIPGSGVFQCWLYFFSFNGTSAAYVRHNLTGAWHAAMYAYEPTP